MKKIVNYFCLLVALLSISLCDVAAQNTVVSEFTEVKSMPKLKKEIKKSGVLYFQSPDRLAMRYSDPEGDYSIIRDGLFLIKRGQGHTQKLKMDGKRTQFQILRNTLLLSMVGDIDGVAKENEASVSIEEKAGKKLVTLLKDKEVKVGVNRLELEYDLTTGALLVLKLIEVNGNSTTYSTPSPNIGASIDEEVWKE